MTAPLVSVILACRNPGARLQAAVASIQQQPGHDIEIVIVDGASTDGTREWLQAHGTKVGPWISAPDRGVYDAMNKGVGLAGGTWLLFMGADDELKADALTGIRAQLTTLSGKLAVGEIAYTDGRVWPAPKKPNVLYRNFLHHQACFYHRSLFADRLYDLSCPIQADYEFNLHLWRSGIRPVPLPIRIASCAPGGLSDGGSWANYRDEIRARHLHFPAWQCLIWDAGSLARYLRKQIVRRFPSHG